MKAAMTPLLPLRGKDDPWCLQTPPRTSAYTMHVDEKDGKTQSLPTRCERSSRPVAANRAEETQRALVVPEWAGAAEDRSGNGAQCPRVSVVLGDVIDIGESA
jgi:hypothetical protein